MFVANCGRDPDMSGSTGYAQDADGPDGRHCDDQRRQRYLARDHRAASSCQEHDRDCPHPGRRGRYYTISISLPGKGIHRMFSNVSVKCAKFFQK